MAISLKDNLTSSYFSAAHKLYSKRHAAESLLMLRVMMM